MQIYNVGLSLHRWQCGRARLWGYNRVQTRRNSTLKSCSRAICVEETCKAGRPANHRLSERKTSLTTPMILNRRLAHERLGAILLKNWTFLLYFWRSCLVSAPLVIAYAPLDSAPLVSRRFCSLIAQHENSPETNCEGCFRPDSTSLQFSVSIKR